VWSDGALQLLIADLVQKTSQLPVAVVVLVVQPCSLSV
jgi:hypothetical protein